MGIHGVEEDENRLAPVRFEPWKQSIQVGATGFARAHAVGQLERRALVKLFEPLV